MGNQGLTREMEEGEEAGTHKENNEAWACKMGQVGRWSLSQQGTPIIGSKKHHTGDGWRGRKTQRWFTSRECPLRETVRRQARGEGEAADARRGQEKTGLPEREKQMFPGQSPLCSQC